MVMVAVVVAVLGGVMLLLHSPTRMAPDNGEPRSYHSIFETFRDHLVNIRPFMSRYVLFMKEERPSGHMLQSNWPPKPDITSFKTAKSRDGHQSQHPPVLLGPSRCLPDNHGKPCRRSHLRRGTHDPHSP